MVLEGFFDHTKELLNIKHSLKHNTYPILMDQEYEFMGPEESITVEYMCRKEPSGGIFCDHQSLSKKSLPIATTQRTLDMERAINE